MLTSRFGFGYGMGYAAYKEATALASLGHSITVAHCYTDPDINRFYDPRITFIYLPIKKVPLIGFLMYIFKLKQFINKKTINNFDSIYIQSLEFGLLNLAIIKTPIFYYARSTMLGLRNVLKNEGIKISPLAKIINLVLITLERRCMHYSKIVFVKSPQMLNEVSILYNINLKKLAIITGGIDNKDFQPQPESSCIEFKRKLKIPPNVPVVLYAGRIVPQKGLLYLIKASINLLKEMNFVVIIAGANTNQSYVTKIKHLLDGSSYQKSFYFLGHINQMNMSLIFSSADCLVTPSLYEPFGMVNLQAAFLGKNVITTNVTGSIDLLSNYEKIKTVKAGSITAIELTLKEVLLQKSATNWSPIDLGIYSWQKVAEQLFQYFSIF